MILTAAGKVSFSLRVLGVFHLPILISESNIFLAGFVEGMSKVMVTLWMMSILLPSFTYLCCWRGRTHVLTWLPTFSFKVPRMLYLCLADLSSLRFGKINNLSVPFLYLLVYIHMEQFYGYFS